MSAPSQREPHIQGLRAVAVLSVLAFHSGLPLPGGFVGVDVFFVISGYVITAMLLRELAASGRIRFRRFYIRRFKRLTPALAATVSAACIASAFVLSPLGPQQHAATTAIGAMLLLANYTIASTTGAYFDAPAATNPLLNIWSLSVEEQFYLGFPLLMFVAWAWARRTGRSAHTTAFVALVGLTSFALAVYGSQSVTAGRFAIGFYSPFTRAWEFAAGALLALLPRPRWTREGATVTSALGAGLLLAAFFEISGSLPFPGYWTLLPVAASVLLISGGAAVEGRAGHGALRVNLVGRLLASRAMVAIGDWSYSLYLWHWPCIVIATVLWPDSSLVAPTATIASVVPALLSYRFLEQPIRAREFNSRALLRLVGTTLAIPLGLAFGLHTVAESYWKPRVHTAIKPAAANAMHAGYIAGCHYEPGDGAKDPKPCVWNADLTGTPTYLLGDSNAAQFEEALMDATKAEGGRLTASTTSGCPLLDVELEGPDFPGYGKTCRARDERLLRWMAKMPAGVVFIGASDDYWYSPGWSIVTTAGATSDHADMIRAMRASLLRVVRRLQQDGHRVVLLQTIPHWVGDHAWDPARCTLASALKGCVQSMPSAYALSRTSLVRQAISGVGMATGSRVFDVTANVCPDGQCVTSTDTMPVYRDATHITVAMSHALAPEFEAALRAARAG